MAGDVKVAVAYGAVSTSATGTADFTVSGFGTPKACIVFISTDAADDTSFNADTSRSIGLSDFTDNFAVAWQDEDNSARVDCGSYGSSNRCYILLSQAGAVTVAGTASAITDGVRLTNTQNDFGTNKIATVVMFGGADLAVSLDKVQTPNSNGGTVVTTTNIDQDLIFVIGQHGATEDSHSNNIRCSFGVGHIDTSTHTTFVNRCIGFASDHNNTDGSPSCIVQNDLVASLLLATGAAEDWGLELTAATTTSYTLTERVVGSASLAGQEVYVLALDLDDRGSKVGSVDSPTSGTSWSPSVSLGFTPQFVGLGITQAQAEGTIETDADAGPLAISMNAGSGEEVCMSSVNEDAAATTNTADMFRSRAIYYYTHDQATVIQDHSHSSFDSGGWTYTINAENETTARKWFYWAIEEAAVGAATITASLDSALQAQLTAAASLTGALQATAARTATLDAAIAARVADISASLNGALRTSLTVEAALNAAIQAGATIDTSLDAALQASLIHTAAIDAALQRLASDGVSLDAALQALATANISIDATLQTSATADTSLSAALQVAQAITAALDAALQAVNSASVSLGGALQAQNSAVVSLDANLSLAGVTTVMATLDAAIQTARSLTTTLDGALQQSGLTLTATLDGALARTGAVVATLNAAISALITVTASLNAALRGDFTAVATLNAALQATASLSTSLSGNLIGGSQTITATLNAALQKAFTATVSLNAQLIAAAVAGVCPPYGRRTYTVVGGRVIAVPGGRTFTVH